MKNRTQIHTLRTLFELTSKFYPQLTNQFQQLEEYCTDDNPIQNTGVKSLKHIVYNLRGKLNQKELEELFYLMLCEVIAFKNESLLFDDIFSLKSLRRYKSLIPTPKIDIKSLPIKKVNSLKLLINQNEINISSRAIRTIPFLDLVVTLNTNQNILTIDQNPSKKRKKSLPVLKNHFNTNKDLTLIKDSELQLSYSYSLDHPEELIIKTIQILRL